MAVKDANVTHPVHPHISARFSPYVFADRPVAARDLASLFEAARWAPSSFNAQPWRYIVALRSEPAEFARMLACLDEWNQSWAGAAPVLALGVACIRPDPDGEANECAAHDLGAASASLTFEASARGICVHQMAGILPEVARATFEIPVGADPMTALAIGYPAGPERADEPFASRDRAPRERKPLAEIVFHGRYGSAARGL